MHLKIFHSFPVRQGLGDGVCGCGFSGKIRDGRLLIDVFVAASGVHTVGTFTFAADGDVAAGEDSELRTVCALSNAVGYGILLTSSGGGDAGHGVVNGDGTASVIHFS